ncbi:XdhC family protein [Nocardioides sp. T5]|uniref:XdhC family protein n=1 Tax=Nocardioides sp. T5 TaxID=3400182 RepID=UPI003A85988F
MVVSAGEAWGSVGGGNLEETALARARTMIDQGTETPEQARPGPHRQGPHRPRPPVLRWRGHPAARAAAGGRLRRDLRPRPRRSPPGPDPRGARPRPAPRRLPPRPARRRAARPAGRRRARVRVHHSPVPEAALGAVPPGTHVLVMTHDHAEDFALCDAALRCTHLGSVGLIGSAAKWARFRTGLAVEARRSSRRSHPLPDRAARPRLLVKLRLPPSRSRSRPSLMDLLVADRRTLR